MCILLLSAQVFEWGRYIGIDMCPHGEESGCWKLLRSQFKSEVWAVPRHRDKFWCKVTKAVLEGDAWLQTLERQRHALPARCSHRARWSSHILLPCCTCQGWSWLASHCHLAGTASWLYCQRVWKGGVEPTSGEHVQEVTYDYCFSSVQSFSCVRLFATPWIAALQVSLSITNSRSLLRLMSIESVMPSSHLILCHPLLLLPTIPLRIRVFSNESTLCMSWPKYWSSSFSISSSNDYCLEAIIVLLRGLTCDNH